MMDGRFIRNVEIGTISFLPCLLPSSKRWVLCNPFPVEIGLAASKSMLYKSKVM